MTPSALEALFNAALSRTSSYRNLDAVRAFSPAGRACEIVKMTETRGLEIWGGAECSLNRVGDNSFDQTVLSGHQDRPDDLELFAALGLRALRVPALWERISPDQPDQQDWAWTDLRLERLRKLRLKPILGLIHHGSGPRYTSLLDEGFAIGLARHARRTAERYPWVADWTPVNEPLTTARFSTLYGHWHPHLSDERAFWLALLNQVDAIRLSMAEIRAVNPEAQLIQTEDVGRTYGTNVTQSQADFDNERRWMTWDLLCGAVRPGDRFWERLAGLGFGDRLRAILDDPCPPNILGVNHYLTSDRLLDHRIERYPQRCLGGNGRESYADVEAVRVTVPESEGLAGALRATWERYERPLVITESHNGCTREEQMRWLWEAWSTAQDLRSRGADVRAVTTWSLLGSFNWDCLLTHAQGGYEPGAFDVRAPTPRPTRLAKLIRQMADAGHSDDPFATTLGWWRRDIRLQYPPVLRSLGDQVPAPSYRSPRSSTKPILIVGAGGTLGRAFGRRCQWRGLDYVLLDRARLDLTCPRAIRAALETYEPWAVINAAGFVRVDDAEAARDACNAINAGGTISLAKACADIPNVAFSSGLVFDGVLDRPYVESDPVGPLNVYGSSKVRAERGILALDGAALVIRSAAIFSPFDRNNFAHRVVSSLKQGSVVAVANDLTISPTYGPDLVDHTLDLLLDEERGVWHLANQGALTWAEFAGQIAEALGLDARLIHAVPARELGFKAKRPANAALASERGWLMPSLKSAVDRYAATLRGA